MKRLLMGLMLLVTAGAANAGWTIVGDTGDDGDDFIQYVDRATIRRNGNFVKMWDLKNYKTVQTNAGYSYLLSMTQREFDCKEEKLRILALTWFSGQMGNGNPVYSGSDPESGARFTRGASANQLGKLRAESNDETLDYLRADFCIFNA